jgi:hypothetical protein
MPIGVTRKTYTFDRNMAFAEDLNLTASAVVQFAAANVQLDLGDGYYEGDLVIDATVLDVASNDEAYTFILEGCNTSGFGAGSIEALAMKRLEDPASAGALGAMNVEHPIGRYVIPFNNNAPVGTPYRYLRLNVIIAGTTPSVTFSAFISTPSEN